MYFLHKNPKYWPEVFITLLLLTEHSYDTYWPGHMKFVYQLLLSYHIFHPCYSQSCFIFIHCWIQSQQFSCIVGGLWWQFKFSFCILQFSLGILKCSGCDRHVFEFGIWCCASSRIPCLDIFICAVVFILLDWYIRMCVRFISLDCVIDSGSAASVECGLVVLFRYTFMFMLCKAPWVLYNTI